MYSPTRNSLLPLHVTVVLFMLGLRHEKTISSAVGHPVRGTFNSVIVRTRTSRFVPRENRNTSLAHFRFRKNQSTDRGIIHHSSCRTHRQ